jgi:[protein-PII] uridylyltransferase
VSYFMRHDAGDIAWHTRHAVGATYKKGAGAGQRDHRARALSPVGEGLQVLVYAPDQPDLFARICGYFDRAGFSILDAKVHTTRNGYALDTFQVQAQEPLPEHYRELISMVESAWARPCDSRPPAPRPAGPGVAPGQELPDGAARAPAPRRKAQRWLLSISASDRAGLLYSGGARAGRATRSRNLQAGQDHDAGRARGRHLPDQGTWLSFSAVNARMAG